MCQTRNDAFSRYRAGLGCAEAAPIARILPCRAPILGAGAYHRSGITGPAHCALTRL